jgi:NAD(P)H-flavin reductase
MSLVEEGNGVYTYDLRMDLDNDLAIYQFTPGQFNMLYLPGVGESAISMSGSPTQPNSWIHTVRVAGNVTKTLAQLKQGDSLGLRGPFGTGWPIDALHDRHVVIVAGGLGLAPLRPLIYHIASHRKQFKQVTVIVGARTPDGLLFAREYDSWRKLDMDVHVTVDRATEGWHGQIGVVTQLIDRMRLGDPSQTRMLTCGPEVMMKYAAASALRLGIAADSIWLSLERNMQCAAGLCGHCQWGPEFICKDGPVLRYDRIRSLLFVEQL